MRPCEDRYHCHHGKQHHSEVLESRCLKKKILVKSMKKERKEVVTWNMGCKEAIEPAKPVAVTRPRYTVFQKG